MITVPPHKREVGMVFQNYALFPHMTVAANVAFPLKLRGVVGAESARRVERALEMVRLGGYGARGVDQLSGGQRQRISIARAMVLKPKLVVLDEPTSALDLTVQKQIIELLKNLQSKYGLSYMFISHDLRTIKAIAHNILVMHKGKVVEMAPTPALFANPKSDYTRALIDAAFLKD